ncbi:hypothetical protein [Lawsonibacter celer]|uniref:hypothetical protein n=1 Tax=Lawsonibacter celer TaxID=2986526 RepID=UPI0016462D87|nr:hypothetical protein [Lawsonibacter celer]
MKRIFVTILCTAIVFSLLAGCRGEQNDPDPTGTASPTPEASASPAPAADEVVARVDGVDILYSQLAEQMVMLEAMYSGLSDQLTKEELQEKLHTAALSSLENLIAEQILRTKIDEYGLTLTQEEQSAAEAVWEQTLASMTQSVQSTYPDLEGDDLDAMVQIALEGSGLQEETVVASAVQSALVNKLKEQVAAQQPAPSKAEVEASYQQLLEEQKSSFDESPTAFESQALGGGPLAYVPQRYRVLQEIYLRFDDEVIQLLEQMKQYDDEESDSYEEMLALEYQRLREGALPELRRRLEDGTSFASLMEEVKPGSSSTYNYVSENTTRLSQEYKDAALSISAPGQVSEGEVKLEYGYAVLYWADTLEPGVRPLEEVYDAIAAQLAKQSGSQAWSQIQAQWRQEASVEIYEERLGY